ncbi:MAG: nucleoside phosphorylase [Patescibacteria group bacterium]|jgi:uridine phosphorylase|nr:nucleoside phosphorylase [Patescibacteria group bacterium]
MIKSTAKNPKGENNCQYHIACRKNELASYALLPGDPGRVLKITKNWEKKKQIAFNREYRSITGYFKNLKISCVSTGIGAPSAAIAIEEMIRLNVHTFIRVGSTGAIQKGINPGDLIINIGAVRSDGTSKSYIQPTYPALANYEVVMALIEACEKLSIKYHLGISASTDAFYVGEGRLGFRGYNQAALKNIVPDLQKANVINLDMENSIIFTLASLYNFRAGAICVVFDNLITNKWIVKGEEKLGKVASESMVILNQWDKIKKKRKKKYFYPSLIY